jgi:hypothetical protein
VKGLILLALFAEALPDSRPFFALLADGFGDGAGRGGLFKTLYFAEFVI